MELRTLSILDASGLHARPAARFVQVASRFASRVVIRNGDRSADAKSLSALLGLGVRPGGEITLEADGPDEVLAIETLITELAPYAAPASPITAPIEP